MLNARARISSQQSSQHALALGPVNHRWQSSCCARASCRVAQSRASSCAIDQRASSNLDYERAHAASSTSMLIGGERPARARTSNKNLNMRARRSIDDDDEHVYSRRALVMRVQREFGMLLARFALISRDLELIGDDSLRLSAVRANRRSINSSACVPRSLIKRAAQHAPPTTLVCHANARSCHHQRLFGGGGGSDAGGAQTLADACRR